MNRDFIDKANEVLASKDEKRIQEFTSSEEYLQFKEQFAQAWTRIKSAINSYLGNVRPVFRQLIDAKKENDHYIRYTSYTKKKSQRKNWKKWKK